MSAAGDRREPTVRTIRGDIAVSELGPTLIHEHLFVTNTVYWAPEHDPALAYERVSLDTLSDVRSNAFACRDNLIINDPVLVRAELARYRSVGGRTILDVTPRGLGRSPRAAAWASEQAGVHVIAGAGYYTRASYPQGVDERSVEQLTEDILQDLTEGMDGTEVRAGVIGEVGGGSHPLHPTEIRVLRAAARAQQVAGAGIVTHSAVGEDPPFEVAKTLAQAGADMTRVVIGHLDVRFRNNIPLFKELGAMGVRFGLDDFGREIYFEARKRQHPSDESRIDDLCNLLDAGFGDRIVLSHDICLKHEHTAFGGHGWSHIPRNILPRLRDRGVTPDQIDQMLIRNPAYVLAGVP